MVRLSSCWLALTLGACGFTISGGAQTDTDAGSGSDGGDPGDGPTPVACPWPFQPEYLDMPCPAMDGPTLDLSAGSYAFDTTSGVLTDPQDMVVATVTEMRGPLRILWTRGLRIGGASALRVTGMHPFVVVSTGSITLDGTLDGSSKWDGADPELGPGADASACALQPGAKPGATCAQHGGSGGGGGGFGGLGGQGGEGGDTHDCGAGVMGLPGGAGGVATLARPMLLRGGCPGGAGAPNNAASAALTPGGHGGGAIALIARDTIAINSSVRTGGSGGRGANGSRAGGGGGGSGGMIVLEAVTITINTSGRVAANGGGGGGGADNNQAEDGDDAASGANGADGGNGEGNGTAGADGGARGVAAGSANPAQRGGGGGGGAVGYVRVHATTATNNGSISPDPSP